LIRIGKKTECFISNFIIVFKVALKLWAINGKVLQ
jgi:hypothetical protein